jgi:putative DNA primase/helicase
MIAWEAFTVGDHRVACPVCSRRPSDKTMGVTIGSEEHGVAHCFRCKHIETRHREADLPPAERAAFARRMDALRRQHAAEQLQRQVAAADASAQRWAGAPPAGGHPYLSTKGVMAHGLRVEAGHTLLIPLRDAAGKLHSLQSIAPDGSKRFMPGGRVKGCYHAIGRPAGRLVLAEGYSTGATIHEDTGDAVAVAFNSGNLLPVARALRAKFPELTLVVAADDDWKTEGNPGLTAATIAARDVGALLAVPKFGDLPRTATDTDFNDLHRLAGMVEVAA